MESDARPHPADGHLRDQLLRTLDDLQGTLVEQMRAAAGRMTNEQMDALRALDSDRSVVVSAPTGSGKTVIGELAVYMAMALGQRVVYTTPLKALSNQKFGDFQRQFGRERVGLLTGDTSINRDADVLLMTTEVFRNMLLQPESDNPLARVSAADRGFLSIRDLEQGSAEGVSNLS